MSEEDKYKEVIEQEFQNLLDSLPNKDPEYVHRITNAFVFAREAHKGVFRKSGEPYILHPLAVALIASSEIGLGSTSVISALLHDVVEDTDYTIEDIKERFGEKVAVIVEGLTKLSEFSEDTVSKQAENFKKMILTLSMDIRVVFIKIADRLHNMRTLESMRVPSQQKIAAETAYIYAPLAHRLGLFNAKTELDDLSLKYRDPVAYNYISDQIEKTEESRAKLIEHFIGPITEELTARGLNFSIQGKRKSKYSIWHKYQKQNVDFSDIYDIYSILIIFTPIPDRPEKSQCWEIYSHISEIYTPMSNRLKDWLSTPKANGYEALHCTLMGPDGRWVEVQVRSDRMNEISERGYAAYMKYKDDYRTQSDLENWLEDVREQLKSNNESATDFLNSFKRNLFISEILIFTPKGDKKKLPKGSTVLDFAYAIHSDVGKTCLGAKVNGELKPIDYKIKNFEQVEIITSEQSVVRVDKVWLDFVVTARAKNYIKSALKSEVQASSSDGKDKLDIYLKDINLKSNARILDKLMSGYGFTSKNELYLQISAGLVDLEKAKEFIDKKSESKPIKIWGFSITSDKDKETEKVFDNKKTYLLEKVANSELKYNLRSCCSPIPGDDVIGYVDYDNVLQIHKKKCTNAIDLYASHGERIVDVKWTSNIIKTYHAKIKVSGFDRMGIVSKITTMLYKDLDVNMRSIRIDTHEGIFEGDIDVYVSNNKALGEPLTKMKAIKGVDDVRRDEEIESEIPL